MSAQGAQTLLKLGPNQGPKALGLVSRSLSTSTNDNGAQDLQPRRKSKMAKDGIDIATMRKGPGYRSSFSGLVATVFGANGGIGRGVINRMGKNGTQIIMPYRNDPNYLPRMRLVGDLGQVLFSHFHLKDEDSIKKAMKYSDVVVNLIGREFETNNFKFHDVNVAGPALLARCAREMGVDRFIHISSINASETPKKLFLPGGGSKWLKTKWQGEQAVLKEFPNATIFRPCELYGQGDHMVNYYNSWFRKNGIGWNNHDIALWRRGLYSIRAPLDITNMTDAIMAALDDPGTKGQIFEAMGPHKYLQAYLIEWMFETMHAHALYSWDRREQMICPTLWAKAAFWSLGEKLRIPGIKHSCAPTLERLERSQLTEESEGYPNISDLDGVKLHTVQETMTFELEWYRHAQWYKYMSTSDIPKIQPLHPLTVAEIRDIKHELADERRNFEALKKIFSL